MFFKYLKQTNLLISNFYFMQTTNTKKVKANKSVSTETVKVEKLNLSNLTSQLSKIEVKEKLKKQTIYIYPEGYKEVDINSEKGKKFRNSLRNAMKRFSNNVLAYAKQYDISKDNDSLEKLKKEIDLFFVFYKTNYRLNDLTFESISNTKKEDKENDLKLFLQIVKEVQK